MLAVALTALLSLSAAAPDGGAEARKIVLVPLGKVDTRELEVVASALKERINARIEIAAPRELPKSAWYEPRKRWRAEKILDALDADPPKGAWKILAVTQAEISTTKEDIYDWRVAGLGNLSGTSCVLSTWIYKKNLTSKETFDRRLTDLTVHEFGHTLGLDHCETDGCVMRDAKGKALESADSSNLQYCSVCRSKVEAGVLKPVSP